MLYLKRVVLIAGAISCLCPGGTSAFSQEEEESLGESGYDRLVRKRKEEKEKLQGLENLLLDTAVRVHREDAEKARSLLAAWDAARDRLLVNDAATIKKCLLGEEVMTAYFKADGAVENLVRAVNRLTGVLYATKKELAEFGAFMEEASDIEKNQARLLSLAKEQNLAELDRAQGILANRSKILAEKIFGSEFKGFPQRYAGVFIEEARRAMLEAKDMLSGNNQRARRRMDTVLGSLGAGRERLERHWRKLRHTLFTWKLKDFKKTLQGMLTAQREINEKIPGFGGGKNLTRRNRVELRKLAGTESGLEKNIRALARILEEEGQAVLASVLRDLAADMRESAELLAAEDTGGYARYLLNSFAVCLENLCAGLEKREKELLRQPPASTGRVGQAADMFIPPLAQLKLLRKFEAEILERTKAINGRLKQSGRPPGPVDGRILAHLAGRQARVVEMARKLHEQLTK